MLSKVKLNDVLRFVPNKTVFMRVDFNTPISNGKVTSNKRITESLPTIKAILEHNPNGVVLASHLGRPDGKADSQFTLQPVRDELESLLKVKVKFASDCVNEEAKTLSRELKNGELLLLENLRFHAEEEGSFVNERNEKVKVEKTRVREFRETLSSLGNFFVNDAFGTSHRAHSSIVGFNAPIKSPGLLMQKELAFFGKALESPDKPLLIILGGAKVADKLPLIKNLLNVADELIIGGGMAFTFLAVANNMRIGSSIYDADGATLVPEILEAARKKGVKLHFPVDFVCAKSIDDLSSISVFDDQTGIESGFKGLDIGPKSIQNFKRVIMQAKTVVMNGPMGVFEHDSFALGSYEVIKSLIDVTANFNALTIIGGGDTVSLVSKVKGASKALSHVSTGGGASLELLEGRSLPGVDYLSNISDLSTFT